MFTKKTLLEIWFSFSLNVCNAAKKMQECVVGQILYDLKSIQLSQILLLHFAKNPKIFSIVFIVSIFKISGVTFYSGYCSVFYFEFV